MTARDIGKIPSGLFSWYIYLLEDGLSDAAGNQLAENFKELGNLIGPGGLVVRGYDPPSFKRDIEEAYSGVYDYLGVVRPTALLVSDTAPSGLADAAEPFVMVFQQTELSQKHGSVAEFLSKLMATLSDPDSMRSLQDRDPGAERRFWNWLGDHVALKPGLFGCSVDLHKALGEAIKVGEDVVTR